MFVCYYRTMILICTVLFYFSFEIMCILAFDFFMFWTFSMSHSALASNPRLRLPDFGLPPCLSPLQRQIHASGFPILDFLRVSLRSNVQSSLLTPPFWTSSVPSTTSTSNPRLQLPDFGLPPCLTLP